MDDECDENCVECRLIMMEALGEISSEQAAAAWERLERLVALLELEEQG